MVRQAIVVEEFSYTYRGSHRRALDNINFIVEEGECCAIIGPAEAGKSTLLYAFSSIIPFVIKGGVIEGNIMVLGCNPRLTPVEQMIRKVGMVLQNPFVQMSGIKPTVYEEVALPLENLGVPRDAIKERVEATLSMLKIQHLSQREPLTLSGGEMQKLSLASVLVLNPSILLLDEPTSQLDPGSIREFVNILKNLKGGKTLILIENRLEMLPGLADRVIALRNGQIFFSGQISEAFSTGRFIEEKIGVPVWTQLAYQWPYRQTKVLPWSYRECLKWFSLLTSKKSD